MWHPKGDWFEVWDNVADGKPAYVLWRYHQKRATHAFDHKARSTGRHSRITKYNMDESRSIDFYVWSEGCDLRMGPIVYYRVSGT
ncbi:hypothetical protein GCM10023196_056410 [Actinoallomurus vinaceus]|uniref:Uncharacterized protein n=1 Tax=Actinoallomurus vinaceus TaxID=1080074 RepID=A0ABP8UF48_9ACTN